MSRNSEPHVRLPYPRSPGPGRRPHKAFSFEGQQGLNAGASQDGEIDASFLKGTQKISHTPGARERQ